MMMVVSFTPLLFVAVNVVLIVLVFVALKKSKEQRKAFLDSLAGLFDERSGEAIAKAFSPLTILRGHYKGRAALLSADEGGKNKPSEFHVGIVCHAPIEFKIQIQSGGDKFLQALHLEKDVQVGDPDLDEKFVFTCQDPDRFSSWVRRSEVREKLMSMMIADDVTRLHLTKRTLTAAILGYKRKNLTLESVDGILRNTYGMIESIESVFGTGAGSSQL
jgi:hypothetical protein